MALLIRILSSELRRYDRTVSSYMTIQFLRGKYLSQKTALKRAWAGEVVNSLCHFLFYFSNRVNLVTSAWAILEMSRIL